MTNMPLPFQRPQSHTIPLHNMAVLLFLKHLSSPVVMYSEHPQVLYEELQQLIKSVKPTHPQLVEYFGVGPLKSVSFLDTELVGVALQQEPSVSKA